MLLGSDMQFGGEAPSVPSPEIQTRRKKKKAPPGLSREPLSADASVQAACDAVRRKSRRFARWQSAMGAAAPSPASASQQHHPQRSAAAPHRPHGIGGGVGGPSSPPPLPLPASLKLADSGNGSRSSKAATCDRFIATVDSASSGESGFKVTPLNSGQLSSVPHRGEGVPVSLHPKGSNFGTALSSGASSQHQRNLRTIQDTNLNTFPCLSSPSSASLDGGSPDLGRFQLTSGSGGAVASPLGGGLGPSQALLLDLGRQLELLEGTGAIRTSEDALAALYDLVNRKMRRAAAKQEATQPPGMPHPTMSMGSGDIQVTDVRSVGSDPEIGVCETEMSDFDTLDNTTKAIDQTVKSLGLAQTIGGIKTANAKKQQGNLLNFEETGEIVFGIEHVLPGLEGSSSMGATDMSLGAGGISSLVRMPLDSISNHIGIVLIHSESRMTLLWNEMMEEFTGVPAAVALNNDITAFLPFIEDQAYIDECIRAVSQNADLGCKPYVFTFMKADGLNMAHLSMTIVSGRIPGVVMGVGINRPRSTDKLFSKWLFDQVTPKLESVLNTVAGYSGESPAPTPGIAEFKDMLGPSIEFTRLATPFSPFAGVPPHVVSALTETMSLIEKASKVDTSSWGPLNVITTFKKLSVDYQQENHIGISLIFGDNVPEEAHTDMIRYPRAIAYLVTNAVKYSRDGGNVEISVQLEKVGDAGMGNITVEVLTDGQEIPAHVLQAVKDGNITVAPDLLEVQKTIEEMGGSLQFERRQSLQLARRSVSWSMKSHPSMRVTRDNGSVSSAKSLSALKESSCAVTCATVAIPYLACSELDMDDFTSSLKATLNDAKLPMRFVSQEPVFEPDESISQEVQDARKTITDMPVDPLITCLVVESNVVYKMTFCHHLWQRCNHTILHAATQAEVETQLGSVHIDLILLDVDGDSVNVENLLVSLAEKHSNVEVIIASRLVTEQLKAKIADTNWLGVTLPVCPAEFQGALDEAELRILNKKIQKQQIDEIRQIFGNGIVPGAWERGKLLGQGAFGKVYEAILKLMDGRMAVKCMSRDKVDEEALITEVKLMSQFSHPNIIHYFYSQITESEVQIFMEYAQEGSLAGKIPPGGCSEQQASKYMEDIARGLQYLHSQNIAHRDIKVANVLLSRGACKLTDFGTATKVQKSTDDDPGNTGGTVGTPAYMAPEVTGGAAADYAADIWSLGCLLMELCTSKLPFAHKAPDGKSFAIIGYIAKLQPGQRVDYGPHPYGQNTIRFLNDTLVVEPTGRATCEELLKSDLILGTEVMMVRKATVFGLTRDARQASMANVKASFRRPVARPGQTPGRTPATFSFRASPGQGRSRTCPGHVLAQEAQGAVPITDTPPVGLTEKVLKEASAAAALGKLPDFKLSGAPKEQKEVMLVVEAAPGAGDDDDGSDGSFSGWGSDNAGDRAEEEQKARLLANRAVTDVLRRSFVTRKPPKCSH